jgi:hypothetical protein
VDLVTAADVKLGASTWPSAYQLLPAPNAPGNPVILANGVPADFYQQNVALTLGLDPAKLASITKKTFEALDFNNRPSFVQYSFIVGTSVQTVEGISIDSSRPTATFSPWRDNQGDGTVPIWSASYTGGTAVATQMVGGHVDIMNTYAFSSVLYGYFGILAAALAFHPTKPTAAISLNKRVYAPGEGMTVLIIPDVETAQITATLKISRVNGLTAQLAPYGPGQKIMYQGGATNFIRMMLTAPSQTGGFRVDLQGDNATHVTTDRTAGRFAVMKR